MGLTHKRALMVGVRSGPDPILCLIMVGVHHGPDPQTCALIVGVRSRAILAQEATLPDENFLPLPCRGGLLLISGPFRLFGRAS